jgi:hypothetical protein
MSRFADVLTAREFLLSSRACVDLSELQAHDFTLLCGALKHAMPTVAVCLVKRVV